MPGHKFRVSQVVNYNPSRRLDAPRGVYTITARLPQSDDGQFEYRIKHSSEPHERIAKENELTAGRSNPLANDCQGGRMSMTASTALGIAVVGPG
jgi:hypothetical protein